MSANNNQGFIGHWLVTEYVFNPDGTFAGTVQQQRRLDRLENGQIRITQHCEPDAALANHPMSEFAGDWEFVIGVEGRRRRYLGADVIGTGWAWGDNLITGRGIWTRFAHNFTSFSYMVTPTRQLTGGCFARGGATVAIILGVAEPDNGIFPTLTDLIPQPPLHVERGQTEGITGLGSPLLIAKRGRETLTIPWRGTIETFSGDGVSGGITELERRFNASGYEDHYASGGDPFVVAWSPLSGRERIDGTAQGVSTEYGGALRLSSSYQPDADVYFEMIDAYDSETRTLLQIVQGTRDQHMVHFEKVQLKGNL